MLKRLQWMTIGLLFAGGLINYMDRAVFGVLAPLISKELVLDPAQLGLALSVFSFRYTAFCFFGGWAADKFGSKRTLAVSMTIWSVICGLIGTASSLPMLLVLRALFGIGESPWISSANKVLMRWFSKERYTSAFGLASSGQPLGGVVAGPLVGLVAAFFGWRTAFFVVALIGLVWVGFWLIFAADTPEEHRRLDDKGRAEVGRMREGQRANAPVLSGGLGVALRQPKLLVTCCCFFCYSYMLFFFLSWFPSYLTIALHLSTATMGIVSAFPWALGAIGLISGGFICDWMIRRIGDPLKAHKLVLVTGLLLTAACVALCGLAESPTLSVALMAAGVGFLYLTGPTYYAIGLEGVPEESLGAVGGFMIFFVNVGGILAPLITGYIVKSTGSFVGAFVLAAVLVMLGALAVAFFARHPVVSGAATESAPSLNAGRACAAGLSS